MGRSSGLHELLRCQSRGLLCRFRCWYGVRSFPRELPNLHGSNYDLSRSIGDRPPEAHDRREVDAEGDYGFGCGVPGHRIADMTGGIHVVP
jgi:hypothetical protein